MLKKGSAPAAKAVGAMGNLRVMLFAVPVAVPCLPAWSAAIEQREAARG